MNEDGPVRLCCGQRHHSVECPDGLVMCCLCFHRYKPEDLSIDEATGKQIDVCIECKRREEELLKEKEVMKVFVAVATTEFCDQYIFTYYERPNPDDVKKLVWEFESGDEDEMDDYMEIVTVLIEESTVR